MIHTNLTWYVSGKKVAEAIPSTFLQIESKTWNKAPLGLQQKTYVRRFKNNSYKAYLKDGRVISFKLDTPIDTGYYDIQIG